MTQDLIKGFKDFKKHHYSSDQSLMPALYNKGQDPKYFIISCIDSRCHPATLFQAQPGTFFAHKVMGAIVPPYKQGTALAAALQFALNYNNVDTIIILGHTQCGAVKALVNNLDDSEITSFVQIARQAQDKVEHCCHSPDEIIRHTEQEIILHSADNLKKYPSVTKALDEKRAVIKKWQFDMKTGDVLEYSESTKSFENISNQTDNDIEKAKEEHHAQKN